MVNASSPVSDLLTKNIAYQEKFIPPPTIAQYIDLLRSKPLSLPPRICIIACCDPRVIPEYIFGLHLGEVNVMRTPGGSVKPVLGGLLAIDSVQPITDVIIMRHTDCGTAIWTRTGVKNILETRMSKHKPSSVGGVEEELIAMDFCESIGDEHSADESKLKQEMQWLRDSPFVRDDMNIVGMVYETHTGKVKII